MHRVFVYGTLKRGFPNYDLANMQANDFLGRFQTMERYPLVGGGPWHSPIMIIEPGAGHRIFGEIFIYADYVPAAARGA